MSLKLFLTLAFVCLGLALIFTTDEWRVQTFGVNVGGLLPYVGYFSMLLAYLNYFDYFAGSTNTLTQIAPVVGMGAIGLAPSSTTTTQLIPIEENTVEPQILEEDTVPDEIADNGDDEDKLAEDIAAPIKEDDLEQTVEEEDVQEDIPSTEYAKFV